MTDEFGQLEESLLFGSDADECEVIGNDLARVCEDYETFCSTIPDWLDIEEAWLGHGDPYEQCAHDYIMTRMGHGVGFWEESDWDEKAGKVLTEMCRKQGSIETYKEDGYLHVLG